LRQTAIGNIESAQELDPGNERRVEVTGDRLTWTHHPIDAQARTAGAVAGRFDVQIASSGGDRPAQAGIDCPGNGRTEIGQAAIVITLVDVVVFLPLAFVGGQIGRQLNEFAIVIV